MSDDRNTVFPVHVSPPYRERPFWRDLGLADAPQYFEMCKAEDFSQHRKWGVQTHTPAEWSVILGEEEGELAKELCEAHFHHGYPSLDRARRIRDEAVQVATLALKIARMAMEYSGA
jgi:hypothetical protein